MSGENKPKPSKDNKQRDGRFASKNIKHDPQDESARAKFGKSDPNSNGDRHTH